MLLKALAILTCAWSSLQLCKAATEVADRPPVCQVTQVKGYRYACNLRGWVQSPSYLSIEKNVTTTKECAGACLDKPSCKSFRYRKKMQKCYLYKKYLQGMLFTSENYQPGVFSDVACYSKDCNTIAACQAVKSCDVEYFYHGYSGYSEYACGYGLTSHIVGDYTEPTVHRFDGSLATCDAVVRCGKNLPRGPFDLHFDLSSQQWVCTLYMFDIYAYPDLQLQHISARTFTVKNDTVGAAYGFYWSYEYSD